MHKKVKAEYFPWLENRIDLNAKPTFKIIARSMSLTNDSIVMIHKAGEDYVTNFYIRDLITNDEIMNQMDSKEAELLRWVVYSENIDPLKN